MNLRWLFLMAWRDSRRNRSRLMLFMSSIVLGIAALVAINSFGENLQKDINSEAKTLVGADLVLESRQNADKNVLSFIDSLGGEQAKEINFASMVFFPKGNFTRLAQIRAFEGNFPFYGKLSTTPTVAAQTFRTGQKALVDKTIMLQFGVQIGDTVKVGDLSFIVEGQLNGVPGQAGIASSVAPAVCIPMKYLESTNLVQRGSRVNYNFYFKYADNVKPDELIKPYEKHLRTLSLEAETVSKRKASIGRGFSNMADFLNLVAFIALLLGCVGVASAVHIYIKDKLSTVAVLRCLGASGWQSFLIYLIQIIGMGLVGAFLGAILGSLLQQILPVILGDFLPVQNITKNISWSAVLRGMITGVGVSILFALLPLLAIRKISPLHTLRASYEEAENQGFDGWRWVVYALILLFMGGFTYLQTHSWTISAGFLAGIGAAFLLLAGIAKLLTWAVRRYFPSHWNYIWRQSIANLYRPNNQTLILITSIGLGSLLISTLFFIQQLLLGQVAFSGSGNQPNMILFDIQSTQKEDIAKLVQEYKLPLIQQVPVVTMRLEAFNGRNVREIMEDSTAQMARWTLEREYRCTYRDTLIDTEKVIAGEWHGNKPKSNKIYVSLAENLSKAMKAEIGSKLTFNVQGTLIETEVSDIREVNFSRVQTNFFVVFPTGVLEKAPQFHVVITRTNSAEQSANFQKALVQRFANVSCVDLTQILKTVDDVLSKISFVIRFMALFSILTGLVVLISSVIISKYQRIRESVLLRTLGASRRQILWINAIEYFLLGVLAALTGILLSIGGSWLLAKFIFKMPFTPNFMPSLVILCAITFVTVLIGLFNSRGILSKPPLEVLRSEV